LFKTFINKLKNSEYVAGNQFSMADINLFVLLDFASWIKVIPNDDHVNLIKWKEEVSSRESAKVFEN
jgi:glutathione S-transferase